MNKILKIMVLIFLSMMCTSCAMRKIDLEKLHNKNEKYGLIIFRSAYVYNVVRHTGKIMLDLKEDSVLSVTITPKTKALGSPCNHYKDCYYANCQQNNKIRNFINKAVGKHIDEKLFIDKEASDFFEHKVFNHEYFYVMMMLPEGEYKLSLKRTIHSFFGGTRILPMPGYYSFYVKAGHINYIGDFLASSKSIKYVAGGFFSESYLKHNLSAKIFDLYKESRLFIKKFYSEIDMPFTKNIIKEIKYKTNS